METFIYPQFPPDVSAVHIALFTDVADPALLKQRLIAAASIPGPEGEVERAAVNFAFIDARLICSLTHLQTAIYQAILAHTNNTLRTRTVHSEILWALSPGSNITDAIRRYGVSESARTLVLVRVGSPDEVLSVEAQMIAAVPGSLCSLTQLESFTDWELVRKSHKLPHVGSTSPPSTDPRQLDGLIVSLVAAKGVLA